MGQGTVTNNLHHLRSKLPILEHPNKHFSFVILVIFVILVGKIPKGRAICLKKKRLPSLILVISKWWFVAVVHPTEVFEPTLCRARITM